MSDPLAKVQPNKPAELFDLLPTPEVLTTQQQAHIVAKQSAAERYKQITELLRTRGPLAGWQIAEAMGCQLHQISGRLTEMLSEKLIEDSGERRKNPRTGSSGRVVRLIPFSGVTSQQEPL